MMDNYSNKDKGAQFQRVFPGGRCIAMKCTHLKCQKIEFERVSQNAA